MSHSNRARQPTGYTIAGRPATRQEWLRHCYKGGARLARTGGPDDIRLLTEWLNGNSLRGAAAQAATDGYVDESFNQRDPAGPARALGGRKPIRRVLGGW